MLDSFIFRMVVKGGHAKKVFWCGQIIVIENSKLGHPTPASRSGQDSHLSKAASWVAWIG